MTTLHETAYPRLKPDPTRKDLESFYTPKDEELAFVDATAVRPLSRLAVLIHLKLFQRLGYFVLLANVPEPIIRHIAQAAGYRQVKLLEDLATYDTSGAKRGHLARLRDFLDVRALDADGRTWLAAVAETAAETKHTIPDIVNVMLEELVHHRYELPAFSTVERLAINARERVHGRYYGQIADALTPAMRGLIDELLSTAAGSLHSGWQALKRDPKRPTHVEVRNYLQHIRRLQHLADQLPPIAIPIPKLKQFRAMARALDASELAELVPAKRYALAAIFIRSQYAKTLDDAADLFIRLMQKLESSAQQKLIAHQLEHGKRTDFLIGQLRDLLQAYQVEGTDTQRVDAMSGALVADVAVLLAECDEHMAYAGKNYLPFLVKPYATTRPLLLNCLEIMGLESTSQDATMERMIAILLSLRGQRRELVEANSLGLDPQADFTWLSATWRRHVFTKAAASAGSGWINRKYFELAVLAQIKDELKSGDLYIPHGERYDDYREQLVDEATFAKELNAYGEVSGLPTDAEVFVKRLRAELTARADAVDQERVQNFV